MDTLIHFLTDLFVNHPEGMFLYTGGTITIIILNAYYRKVWDEGARGNNGIWDLPEVLSVLFGRWLLPQMLLASYTLPTIAVVPEYAWWVVSFIIFFALTGRWGLEWLGTIKGTTIIKKETSETNATTHSEESTVVNTRTNNSDIN
jgi:hypothetical protein